MRRTDYGHLRDRLGAARAALEAHDQQRFDAECDEEDGEGYFSVPARPHKALFEEVGSLAQRVAVVQLPDQLQVVARRPQHGDGEEDHPDAEAAPEPQEPEGVALLREAAVALFDLVQEEHRHDGPVVQPDRAGGAVGHHVVALSPHDHVRRERGHLQQQKEDRGHEVDQHSFQLTIKSGAGAMRRQEGQISGRPDTPTVLCQ
mmetsp:Transcript_56738/g.146033  ORF Transcript_56738/g.146033 Transcript_56738/m.146033 type:complete len:203 (+) Transcript_56738:51-659(+)